jgi:hypothetical protein
VLDEHKGVSAAVWFVLGLASVACSSTDRGQPGAPDANPAPPSDAAAADSGAMLAGRAGTKSTAGTAGDRAGTAAVGGMAGNAGRGAPANDPSFPDDTFLPWAGGPEYFGRWSHGPPADPAFFPIAVWLQTPSNASRYKAVGINLFVGLWEGPTDAQLMTLKSAAVPTMCDQSGVWDSHLNDTTVWGWLQPDEPDNAQAKPNGGGYDPCIAPSTIVAGYQKMVANDATRPVWLGLGRGVSDTTWVGRGTCSGKTDMYMEYAKGGDILSFDIYPVNDGIGLEAVPKGVDNLRQWSQYTKPVIADIEGSNIDNTKRPSPAQIESEVWMALVHGAAGIQYFCHRFSPTFSETDCLDDATTAAALPGINRRVRDLAPILNTQSIANGVSVKAAAADKPVDTILKRHAGATYLFAVEMRDGSTKATFMLQRFAATASAEVLGEGRTLSLTNGIFEDSFEAYGVHLYKITY